MDSGPINVNVVPVAAELSPTLAISPSALELAFVKSIMDSPGGIGWPAFSHWLRRSSKAHSIPVEILSEIFLLVSQFPGDKRWNWRVLMLVCQRWHAIILLAPGLHSQLRIRKATQKEVVQTFIQGRKTRLGVTVDMNDEGDGGDFDAENFHASFMAAIQGASRWSSLNLISPPPHGEYKDMQILQPLTQLESLNLACGSGEFFEPLMTAISRNAPPNLTAMRLADPAAVLCLARPAFAHIYHSLRTLKILLFKRMDSSVNILPHLQRLETLEACRLCLPPYLPDFSLPLIHTLRFLYLKSVSVQWMAGRIFPALEKCRIIFPHDAETIQATRPVTMPSCSFLLYNDRDLHPLTQFHLPSLHALDVKNAQWGIPRGNHQFASLCPIVAARPQCLTLLRLDVRCSERLLVSMLELAPTLEELWLGLAHANTFRKSFFQAFIAREPNADSVSEMVGSPSETIAPLCPSLKTLHLHYKKWMRGPDEKSLVVAFSDIMGSQQLETKSSFSLRLSFGEALGESHWTIGKPVRKIQNLRDGDFIFGISTLHSIIPMSTLLPERGLVSLPFKNAESLHLSAGVSTSLEFFVNRELMELIVYDYDRPPPPTSLPCALPLFDALRVLVITCDNPSFLAGHTFHKLERCRLLKENRLMHSPSQHMLTRIEMPVCTRVDIDDPWVLAAFKVPQIHELALSFSDPKCSVVWGKHIAVNANLSGLNLLQMKIWPFGEDLIPILSSLSLLETLIITTWSGVESFEAFLPMNANGTSGLKQPSDDGKALVVLCPRLRHLQIESEVLWVRPDLIPFAKDIITLRAECGSPLKVFTFYEFAPKPGRKVELIRRDGSFTIEKSVPAEGAEKFILNI